MCLGFTGSGVAWADPAHADYVEDPYADHVTNGTTARVGTVVGFALLPFSAKGDGVVGTTAVGTVVGTTAVRTVVGTTAVGTTTGARAVGLQLRGASHTGAGSAHPGCESQTG